MPLSNSLFHLNFTQLSKRALQGIVLALLLFSILLLIIGEVESWIYIPMLTVSIGGACGGTFFHLISENWFAKSNYKFLINAACALVFLIGFWLSLVFGLAQVGLWD